MQTQSNTGKQAKALLLLGISLGYFMVLLDTTVVSVALPAIRADLGGGIAGLQWVVNAYTIVFAGLLLSMGAFADKLGAKRVYIGGLILFLAASAISAAAPSLNALIGLRAILGMGGAALMPASPSLPMLSLNRPNVPGLLAYGQRLPEQRWRQDLSLADFWSIRSVGAAFSFSTCHSPSLV